MNRIFQIVALGAWMGSLAGAGQFPLPGRPKIEANRGAVARTEADLKRAEKAERPGGEAKKRYAVALKTLMQFERQMAKTRFKTDLLDKAIGDVEAVVKNNELSAADREALTRDVAALREVRTKRGIGY